MLTDILIAANRYDDGIKQVKERRANWIKKHTELKAHLKKVAEHLNNNTTYKQGFFVDTLRAFNEETNGVCNELPSVTFRSGDMPMLVTFRNSLGELKEYTEDGFRISFSPIITGEILVLLLPHHSDLNEKPAQYNTLAIINDPAAFTMDMADQIIAKGIEAAYYSSFTGMADIQKINEQAEAQKSPRYTPIGFKRYETTEKAKS